MIPRDDLDRTLEAWFEREAPLAAPAGLLTRVVALTAKTRRRPGWYGVDRWRPASWAVVTTPLTVVVMVALTLLLAIAAVLVVGSRPRLPAPFGLARPGLLVFDAGGALAVAAPDGSSVRIFRAPADGLSLSSPSFSRDGTRIAYWSTTALPRVRELIVAGLDGTPSSVIARMSFPSDLGATADAPRVAWSPNGSLVAFAVGSGGVSTLYIARTDGSGLSQVGDPALRPTDPAWSPDGRLIAFRGGADDASRGVYVMQADGSGVRRVSSTPGSGGGAFVPAWSPDGRTIAFSAGDARDQSIWTVGVDGTKARLMGRGALAMVPAWSPDGRHLAWVEEVGGLVGSRSGVFGPRELVIDDTITGGRAEFVDDELDDGAPVWSPDGSHVVAFLRSSSMLGDDRLVLFDVSGRSAPLTVPARGTSAADWQRLAP